MAIFTADIHATADKIAAEGGHPRWPLCVLP